MALLLCCRALAVAPLRAEEIEGRGVVVQLDAADPTRDKPQSKLWFAHGTWWAWLPTRDASSIWRRTAGAWQRLTMLDDSLRGLPGRADVWHDGDGVTAVLVGGTRLAVACLRDPGSQGDYRLVERPVAFEHPGGAADAEIETATIARDGRRRWWVAYPSERRMWVRSAVDASQPGWSDPIPLSDRAADDDLCAVVALPGQVAVVWSDQVDDMMCFRAHRDQMPVDRWEDIEVIDRGNRCADDHLHAAVGADGTLFLATKNSVDRVGEPQLVLRVRRPSGRWENYPFAARTEVAEPSRPIVLVSEQPRRLNLLYTLYGRAADRRGANSIVGRFVSQPDVAQRELDSEERLLIGPATGLNNVTGCKNALAAGVAPLVLASDRSGRVYEAILDPLAPAVTGGSANAQ